MCSFPDRIQGTLSALTRPRQFLPAAPEITQVQVTTQQYMQGKKQEPP